MGHVIFAIIIMVLVIAGVGGLFVIIKGDNYKE